MEPEGVHSGPALGGARPTNQDRLTKDKKRVEEHRGAMIGYLEVFASRKYQNETKDLKLRNGEL